MISLLTFIDGSDGGGKKQHVLSMGNEINVYVYLPCPAGGSWGAGQCGEWAALPGLTCRGGGHG